MSNLSSCFIKMIMLTVTFLAVTPTVVAKNNKNLCVLAQLGAEKPSASFPNHPTRRGYYLYYSDSESDKMGLTLDNCSYTPKQKPIFSQMGDAYKLFSGCESALTANHPCDDANGRNDWSDTMAASALAEACGSPNPVLKMKLGHYYYCAGGGMMERTDFIPVLGCNRNSYAGSMNCQPCPAGTYSKRGATDRSQCLSKTQNESVWAISTANFQGVFSCPEGANKQNGGKNAGECICDKGKNWTKKKKACK